jgi:hypothetical protein
MSRSLILLCATLVAATLAVGASAQNVPPVRAIQVQPIKLEPIQPATQPAQAAQASPVAREAGETDAAVAGIQPIETVESIKAANQKLREANKILRNENNSLKDRITQMTTRGGSLVRAYCPTETTSANTAGAESNCGATGYKCEDVSGLCHKTCSSSDQCVGGYSCNPCNNRCENNAGPITQC